MKKGAFVGEIWNEEDHWYLIHPFDLPFHFEEIKPEPVKPKLIMMQEIHDTILSICINRRYEVLSKLAVRIHHDHDLS